MSKLHTSHRLETLADNPLLTANNWIITSGLAWPRGLPADLPAKSNRLKFRPDLSTITVVMPGSMSNSGIRDNHRRGLVADFLKAKITDGSRLSVVSAYFTIYAYEALKDHLDRIEHLDFLFGEPRFIASLGRGRGRVHLRVERGEEEILEKPSRPTPRRTRHRSTGGSTTVSIASTACRRTKSKSWRKARSVQALCRRTSTQNSVTQTR